MLLLIIHPFLFLVCFSAPSFFDLLADDAPNGNSEGSPAREAHVAFSVEGMVFVDLESKGRIHAPLTCTHSSNSQELLVRSFYGMLFVTWKTKHLL